MTKAELEVKVDGLNKELDGLRDAIRNMSSQIDGITSMLAKLHQDTLDIKTDVMKAKNLAQASATNAKKEVGMKTGMGMY